MWYQTGCSPLQIDLLLTRVPAVLVNQSACVFKWEPWWSGTSQNHFPIAISRGLMLCCSVLICLHFQTRARVKLLDFGTQEGYQFIEIWPYVQELGKNEPHQCFDCTALDDLTNARDPRYNEARWLFGSTVQTLMSTSGGSNMIKITFKSKVGCVDRDDSRFWV